MKPTYLPRNMEDGEAQSYLNGGWTWALLIFFGTFAILILLTVLYCYAIYKQEIRAYRNTSFPRICLFVFIWVFGSFWAVIKLAPLIICQGFKPFHPKVAEKAFEYTTNLGKTMTRSVTTAPVVMGKENLPDPLKTVIYVANHQSILDICLLYWIDRRFRWVSKSSVFTIPGVGIVMTLVQDIPLTRGKANSIQKMFAACKHSLVDEGVSVMIFPQGTRKRFEILPFKEGAFELAVDCNIPVVPLTVSIPSDVWFDRKSQCTLTVHPAIKPASDAAELQKEAYQAVMSALPYYSKELEEKGLASSKAAKERRKARQSPQPSGFNELNESLEKSPQLV